MTELGWIASLLFIIWLLHVMLWRVAMPANHTKTLLALFTFAPFPVGLMMTLSGMPAPDGQLGWMTIACCYYPCALCYIIFYSTLEYQSPTCAMVLMIHKEGTLAHDELVRRMDAGDMIKSRLESMVQTGLSYRSAEGYTLTERGRNMATLFTNIAELFGIARHGG